jgi:ORF6N domain
MSNENTLVTPLEVSQIAQRIQLIRGHRVILDTDLAAFYGETTKRFNQQVRRNLARFPADFMFQLDAEEAKSLRLQFATLDADQDGKPGRGRYSKYLPLAFTEHGAIMAATLLNSPRATEISVHVVRAFVEWRTMLASNRELAKKLHQLEGKVSKHDASIGSLIEAMQKLLAEPVPAAKRPIGFVHPAEASKPKPIKSTKPMSMKKARK